MGFLVYLCVITCHGNSFLAASCPPTILEVDFGTPHLQVADVVAGAAVGNTTGGTVVGGGVGVGGKQAKVMHIDEKKRRSVFIIVGFRAS